MKFTLIIDKEKEEEITVTAHSRSELVNRIEALAAKETAGPIVAYTDDDMVLLSAEEIECITVQDGKTYAIDSRNRRYRLKHRLYELEDLLSPAFLRINKSALANEARLVRFTASFNGAVDAVFRCGYTEYVSRRCFAQIKRRIETK